MCSVTNPSDVSESIKYVGVNDLDIDLFEGQFTVPDGMAYNSFVILDKKTAITDTVDRTFGDDWLKNINIATGGDKVDYLIVHHMEPDHSANILRFAKAYPEATIVSSAKAFAMMKQFFGTDFADRRIVVGEGDTLELGEHTLKFVAAPMVHWPEVIVSYESKEKVLFSADAFGKFGAIGKGDGEWDCEARRYYFGIVGKFGAPAQALLKKASALDIKVICPLHGPVLKENPEHYIGLYKLWSAYSVESEGVTVAYTSVYGNTKEAAELLKKELLLSGCKKVALTDLARDDMAEAVEDAFRYGTLVLATTTYNGGIFPFMRTFIEELTERGYRGRKIAFIENGSWAPTAAKTMAAMLEGCKDLTYAQNTVTIRSALTDENRLQIAALAKELCE